MIDLITIDLEDENYTVHALRYEYIDGIEESKLLKLLKKFRCNQKNMQAITTM